jgi:hypothetical protein
MKRAAKIVLISALVGMPILLVVDQTVGKGVSWADMDWNNDGHTSLGEVADAFNVDVRSIAVDGKHCREVYQLKDGLPVRELCP